MRSGVAMKSINSHHAMAAFANDSIPMKQQRSGKSR